MNANEIQKTLDIMSASSRQTRGDYHLTLGGLILILERSAQDIFVEYDNGTMPGSASSYRGYYSDLSFEPCNTPITVQMFLVVAKNVLGQTLEGYKGGDFKMDEKTPLWAAEWGDLGPAIIGTILKDNKMILVTKEIA